MIQIPISRLRRGQLQHLQSQPGAVEALETRRHEDSVVSSGLRNLFRVTVVRLFLSDVTQGQLTQQLMVVIPMSLQAKAPQRGHTFE
jgi:hypothetical protein